ncbi:basic amino acid/polyamine antiporter [Bowdeniella nasicola]|uniref:basic amino acid/polyamine antiporter n=1 Tax=Bowdeniella nasicola TaxID=208480 RepID=UPI0009F844B6|nr:basic amino acid/polyamine antiporter [Bowdeniella nasicola]
MSDNESGDFSGRPSHGAAPVDTTHPESTEHQSKGTLTFLPLLALVVGSMIGGGIFNLSRDVAETTAPGPAMIGWFITAVGMCCLALCFQTLANRRPDLDAGVYAYARALFGRLVGFLSSWGYWFSAWVGNIAYFVLLFGTLSLWFKGFGSGTTWTAIIAASVLLWALHLLVIRGVRQAAIVNTISTIAKLVPIFLFIVIMIFAFNFELFTGDFWGTESGLGSIFSQTRGMMLVTVWVFIGIEGASIYSARAKHRRDVGKATVVGFILVLVLLMLVNLLSHGVLQQAQISGMAEPAMAGILESVIGRPGTIIVSVGLVISLFGALLAWILIPVEIMQVAGEDGTMPKVFGKLNEQGSPSAALWLTSVCMQVTLILTGFMGEGVYKSMISLASALILVPYLLSALYATYLAFTKSTYENDPSSRSRDLVLGVIASIYGVWLLYGAGLNYLLLAALLYAPGLIIHAWARRERGEKVFNSTAEMVLAGLLVVAAIVAGVMLSTGAIEL